jgi:hypothetical protein
MGTRRQLVRGLAAVAAGVLTVTAVASGSPSGAATSGPSLYVNAASGLHAIPDTIYGINWASHHLRTTLKLPVSRWGGNATSLYNYQSNAYNNGNDWFFENQTNDAGFRLSPWVGANKADGTASLVTVPMLGWVADGGKPQACAFSIAKYGAQDAHDTWRPDCGNGLRSGQPITGNTPTDFAVQVNPGSWAGGMVASLTASFGTAANGGVRYYNLDNEPGLWSSTHRSVHPAKLDHTDWMSRSVPTAAAIKATDPSAKVLAPSDDGYCRWLYDDADDCNPNGANHVATGDLAPWYVKQFKAYADAHGGKRLLDYLDEHYYPQSDGVSLTTSAGSTATQALRLRSTRSLWDPTYKDESWIGGVNDVNAPPLQFIRKIRAWAALYPGTKTAITEYNWGAMNSINGAVAQADVLGIFGREGLDLATLWWNDDGPVDGSPVEWAFRIYRNYDGNGARFGSTGVGAASTDQGNVSVYAAKTSTLLTVVVVNKAFGALTSPMRLYNYPHQSAARSFTIAPTTPKAIAQKAFSVGPSGFSYTYPAQSVTLIRITHS